jgi:hypothetical protein
MLVLRIIHPQGASPTVAHRRPGWGVGEESAPARRPPPRAVDDAAQNSLENIMDLNGPLLYAAICEVETGKSCSQKTSNTQSMGKIGVCTSRLLSFFLLQMPLRCVFERPGSRTVGYKVETRDRTKMQNVIQANCRERLRIVLSIDHLSSRAAPLLSLWPRGPSCDLCPNASAHKESILLFWRILGAYCR